MSSDESTIPFPANKLKAETLRLMAKDLGVVPGGKKVELLQRLRASSASGWGSPTKRKSDPEAFETPPPTTKKPKTPRTLPTRSFETVVELRSPTRRSSKRNRGVAAAKALPQQEKQEDPSEADASNVSNEEEKHVETKPGIFDDYLAAGPTSVFISGDDLLTIVGEVPASATLTLWKVTSKSGPSPNLARANPWLILANGGDKIQNVTAFKEAYKDVLEKQRELKSATPVRNEVPDDVGIKDSAMASEGQEPIKQWWYEVSVSRNLGNGALAVNLIQGTIAGKRIVPVKDAKEEDGTFWLSRPTAAKKDDSKVLDHGVKLLS